MDDEAPEAPQVDAPIQMGADLMGMVSDPATMVHHSGLGPFVDNSQWKKPVQDVGAKESDIQDYVGKGTAYYQQKLQESFPDLSDERKQKLLKGFSDTLTNHVRDYAVERYASVLNQQGQSSYYIGRNIAEATPFVGIGTEWYEKSKREEAQQHIAEGKGQPWDFFVEALNRDRERRIANIPGGGILHGAEGLARFGIEALGAGAAGMMPADNAPLLTRALGAGAGLTGAQLPGLVTGAIWARSNPTEVAEHVAKDFVNNAAFVGVAGLGSAGKEEAAGAIKSALKLIAAGEVAPDLTSGFGYLGQPGSLLAALQSKTPEERAANLANFGSQAGAALLFEGAVKLMKGGWKPTGNKVLEAGLKQEQASQPTQTTTETPTEAETPTAPSTPTAPDAPGTPISPAGESTATEATVQPEAQSGTPVQDNRERRIAELAAEQVPSRTAEAMANVEHGTPEERSALLNQPTKYPLFTAAQRKVLSEALSPLPQIPDLEAKLKEGGYSLSAVAKRVELSGATSRSEWFDWARKNKAWPGDQLRNDYAAALAAEAGRTGSVPKPGTTPDIGKVTADELAATNGDLQANNHAPLSSDEVSAVERNGRQEETSSSFQAGVRAADAEVQGNSTNGQPRPAEPTAAPVAKTRSQRTKELLDAVDQGGAPAFMSNRLKGLAEEWKIKVGPDDTPQSVIDQIRQKRKGGRPRNTELDNALSELEEAHDALKNTTMPARVAAWERTGEEGPGKPVLSEQESDAETDKLMDFETALRKVVHEAKRSGWNPTVALAHVEGLHDTINTLLPHLEALFQDISQKPRSKETQDADRANSASIGNDEASVRRAVDEQLQGEIKGTRTPPPGSPGLKGSAESLGKQPGKRPTTVPETANNKLEQEFRDRASDVAAKVKNGSLSYEEGQRQINGIRNEIKSRASAPADHVALAKSLMAQEQEQIQEHNEMVREMRSMIGNGHWQRIGKDKGYEDSASIPHFDEVVQHMMGRGQEWGQGTETGDYLRQRERLFEMLKRGTLKPMKLSEAMERARDMIEAQKEEEAYARYRGESATTPGENRQAQSEILREEAASESDESGHTGDAGDFNPAEFERPADQPTFFGGKQLGGSQRKMFSDEPVPPDPLAAKPQVASLEGQQSFLAPGRTGGPGAEGIGPAAGGQPGARQSGVGDVGDTADHGLVADATSVTGWQRWSDFWAKLSGATAPRMTRESKPSSEKLSQLAAVRDYLHERLPQLIDKVIGRDTTPEEAKVIGTTFQEMRHRSAIQAVNDYADKLFRDSEAVRARNATETKPKVRAKNIAKAAELANEAHDAKKWAAGISTFVGGKDSPLTDEATYQAYANSPRMKDFLQRWQQLVVPEMEKNTRSARGLEDSDPIDSLTQMPGFPMHAKAIREGDAPLASVGARRGNLQGMSLKRDPYQNRAGLSHTLYDTDIRSIMEESLRKTTRNARLAEFYRTAVAEGIGKWLAPNASEEGYSKIPHTKPPMGTQNAEPGDQFWIKSHLYDETHQAMGLDRQFAKIPFTNSATWWALQSTAEATYHAKNLLTGMFKPGMSVGDLFKNAYEVITKDPYAAERMVDLARMEAGTTRQSTFNLKNPMTYMGKMIDLMDRSVRLTAGDAFDRMLRTGSTGKLAEALGVKVKLDGSEASKRDFINQVAGNYNKLTQSRMVAWARDVGIGPFATAGTTYWANGVRSLVGGHGLEAADLASDLKLRATMMAKPLAILGAVMAFNYARWNRVDGDDGTPFGSMKLGERNGKTVSFNPLVFTGLPRGIRAAGAMPALEQVTHGKPVGTAEVGKGLTNVAGSALHPFFGPAGQVVTEGVTGHNIMGMKTAPDARRGESQAWLNWKAALLNSNPIVSNFSGADNPYKDKADWVEKTWKLLGPFGPQFRKPPKH